MERARGMMGYGTPKKEQAPQPAAKVEQAKPVEKPKDWVIAQKAKMEKLWKEGEWEKAAKDIESVLPPEVASREIVNVGVGEVKGFERQVIGERVLEKPKKRCDDRKINDPERGLYAVMDGVSSGHGAIASEITSRVVAERMGEKLDAMIEKAAQLAEGDEEWINETVAKAMQDSVRESNEAVKKIQEINPEYKGANTTLSLAKMVEMPDGKIRLYYTNIGDSRVYLENDNGSMTPLTEDDNQLNAMIEAGRVKLTPEEAEEIDQFTDYEALSDQQKRYVNMRNRITEAIGTDGPKVEGLRFDPEDPKNSDILWVDLEPGQRFVISSDGVHDNATKQQMEDVMRQSEGNPLLAESLLQELAVSIEKDPKNPRSKPDDTSAVVGAAFRRRRVQPAGSGSGGSGAGVGAAKLRDSLKRDVPPSQAVASRDAGAAKLREALKRDVPPSKAEQSVLEEPQELDEANIEALSNEAEVAADNNAEADADTWEQWRQHLVDTGVLDPKGRWSKPHPSLSREQMAYVLELQRQKAQESSSTDVIAAKEAAVQAFQKAS